MEKNNIGLVKWARKMVGQAYWQGTCCFPCTNSLLASKSAQYPSHYTESRMSRYRGDIAEDRIAMDAIGLILGYLWNKQGRLVYNADTDVDSRDLFRRADVLGSIVTIPEIPGLIVYKDSHVGVYEGDGIVIEAKDFAHGVIRTKLTDTKWTHWIALPWISYNGFDARFPETVEGSYVALGISKSAAEIGCDNEDDTDIRGLPGFVPSETEPLYSAIVVGDKAGLILFRHKGSDKKGEDMVR